MPVLDEITLGDDRGIVIAGWHFRVSNAEDDEINMSGVGTFDIKDPRLPSGEALDDANKKELDVTVTVGQNTFNWSSALTLGAGQTFEVAGWVVTPAGIENNDQIDSAAGTPGQ